MSCVWLIFGVLGLASRVRCHEEVNRSLPLPTQVKQMLKGRSHCPTPECDFLGPAARYTGKYAIVMSGRIRVAHDMVQRLLPIIEKRYSGDVKVDWFIHTWKNESSLCELKTLEEMKMVATVITTEPVESCRVVRTCGARNSRTDDACDCVGACGAGANRRGRTSGTESTSRGKRWHASGGWRTTR